MEKRNHLLTLFLATACVAPLTAQNRYEQPLLKAKAVFSEPVLLMAGGEPIATDAPGYAAPCWADVNGDGLKDLVVGQFDDGKMKVYRSDGKGGFAPGEWLQAGGKTAEVPGVW